MTGRVSCGIVILSEITDKNITFKGFFTYSAEELEGDKIGDI